MSRSIVLLEYTEITRSHTRQAQSEAPHARNVPFIFTTESTNVRSVHSSWTRDYYLVKVVSAADTRVQVEPTNCLSRRSRRTHAIILRFFWCGYLDYFLISKPI